MGASIRLTTAVIFTSLFLNESLRVAPSAAFIKFTEHFLREENEVEDVPECTKSLEAILSFG